MPRDSSDTRARIIDEAERLFASRGIWQVPTREIVEAAGQRNASAVSYHFGSRDGLLDHILTSHGDPIDAERGELLDGLDARTSTAAIVDALVRPMTARLASDSGRRYLRIVNQLAFRFEGSTAENQLLPENVRRALGWLEERPAGLPVEVRHERVRAMVLLMSASLAERARKVGRGIEELNDAAYEATLTDVLVGVIEAPASMRA